MLTAYPFFAPLNIGMREEIVAITDQFPAYSDFNFVNLMSWNQRDDLEVCALNDNLVVRLRDYVTGSAFFSFIGQHQIEATARTVLEDARIQQTEARLRLVPAECAAALQSLDHLAVSEDPDNHDYIIGIPQLLAHEGKKYAHLRRSLNTFRSTYGIGSELKVLNLENADTQQEILQVFVSRESSKNHNDHTAEQEALMRLFTFAPYFQLHAFGLYVHGQLAAFIVFELLDETTCLGHFWKADTSYKGIYHYFLYESATILAQNGFTAINIEQDLGLPGLRMAKQFFNPSHYLKKYTVALAG